MPKQKTTKDMILAKAAELFRKQGFHNTSIGDIASDLGIFKSAMYHYFKDKEDIMIEALKRAHQDHRGDQLSILYNKSLKPRGRLAKYLKKVEEEMFAGEGGSFLGNISLETSCTNDNFRELIKDNFADWQMALKDLFREKHAPKKAGDLAIQAISDIEGGMMMTRIHKDRSYFDKAVARIKKYL